MNDSTVKPDLPGGFKDYSPSQVLVRQGMFRTIEMVYRRFGFIPLQTSVGQWRDVLTGKKPPEQRLWDMVVDKTDDVDEKHDVKLTVTARFDLTVPLARYVAENIGTLVFPFRRYEYGEVFRGENPQAGRYCEFMQYDADIVGAPTGAADAEMLLCMAAVMKELGISRFLIKLNHRKVLNGFAERVGLSTDSKSAAALLRIMDKADKIGIDGVLMELASKTTPNGEKEVFSFNETQLSLIQSFMTLMDGLTTNDERFAVLDAYFGGIGIGADGIRELKLIISLLRAGSMPEDVWAIDTSIARGLGYYTGPVFETILLDKPKIGSIYSGGRYDHLLDRFTGHPLPCVGASVGVDRLFVALEELGIAASPEPYVDVFIMWLDPTFGPQYFALAAECRAAGLRTEIYMGYQDYSPRAQMPAALDRRAPVVLFYGPREAESGTIAVKNTATRKQVTVPRADLMKEIFTVLGRMA